jgi:hypothetical protein
VGVDVKVVQEAIYWRGLFICRYAAIEFAIAELVSRAFMHQAYAHLGHPRFGPAKKLKRLNEILKLTGPMAAYRSDLQLRLDEFAQYADHRNFMVHGIMVPTSDKDIAFRMYDHREGVYSVGDLQFEMKHLESIATLIGEISTELPSLVAKICRELSLPEV